MDNLSPICYLLNLTAHFEYVLLRLYNIWTSNNKKGFCALYFEDVYIGDEI